MNRWCESPGFPGVGLPCATDTDTGGAVRAEGLPHGKLME